MTNKNVETLKTGYDAFDRGDVDTVMGLFADDIQWHVPGQSLVSGDYSGKEEVGGFFGKLMDLSSGTFRIEIHDLLANEEHGIALVTLKAERNGRTLDAKDAHIWHLKDGIATEYWACTFDLTAYDAFWS